MKNPNILLLFIFRPLPSLLPTSPMGSIVSFCEPQTNRLSVGQDDRIAVNAPQQTATSSENSASKQQLSNGSSSHRFDMGRRYVNQPDVAYMLPNDDEGIAQADG